VDHPPLRGHLRRRSLPSGRRSRCPAAPGAFPARLARLNREPSELDPRLFADALPPYANARSPRVAGGLGTIPRIVAENEEIYDAPLPVAEGLARIEGAYLPYHAALTALISQTRTSFGCAVLVDCHSMPSSTGPKDDRPRADVVLGDRYGTSCVGVVSETVETTLRQFGYAVSRNKPYAGGFITEHYGNPAAGLHAIQLEIKRGLYPDERRFERSADFARLAANMETLADALAAIPLQELRPYRSAAE
jgi:N-formylglutamate deformylase